MKKYFTLYFVVVSFALAFSNDFYQTWAQTAPFTLKAGNKSDPIKFSHVVKHSILSIQPSITIVKSLRRHTIVSLNIPKACSGRYSFFVYDFRGRVITKKNIDFAANATVSLTLPSGYYILCLKSAKYAISNRCLVH